MRTLYSIYYQLCVKYPDGSVHNGIYSSGKAELAEIMYDVSKRYPQRKYWIKKHG